MTAAHARELTADEVFGAWLARFGEAWASADPARLAGCFVEDGYWKEILTFDWDFRTHAGRDEIREGFAATLSRTRPGGARPATDRSGPRLLKRSGRQVVEGFLDLDT